MAPEWLRAAAVLSQCLLPNGGPDPISREWAAAIVSFVAASPSGRTALRLMVVCDKVCKNTVPSSHASHPPTLLFLSLCLLLPCLLLLVWSLPTLLIMCACLCQIRASWGAVPLQRVPQSPHGHHRQLSQRKSASWLLKQSYSQHLWQGHQLFIAGDLPGAALSYACAGVLGSAALAVVHLCLYDVPAAVSLALRVAEFCFTPRWKKMGSGSSGR
jgi:hypothetical protein